MPRPTNTPQLEELYNELSHILDTPTDKETALRRDLAIARHRLRRLYGLLKRDATDTVLDNPEVISWFNRDGDPV